MSCNGNAAGGYHWPVQILKAGHRTEAYRLLHEMQRWFPNKRALSIEQKHMLQLGVLPMVAAYLRPPHVVDEEQEAEAGNTHVGHVASMIWNIAAPCHAVQCSAVAAEHFALLNERSNARASRERQMPMLASPHLCSLTSPAC